jgi:hypothetical protein
VAKFKQFYAATGGQKIQSYGLSIENQTKWIWAVKFQLAYTMAEKTKLGVSRHYGCCPAPQAAKNSQVVCRRMQNSVGSFL